MIRITTESGSRYVFDNDAMTWSRESDHPITFMEDCDSGLLAAPVEPRVGARLTFFLPGDDWVVTTPVTDIDEA